MTVQITPTKGRMLACGCRIDPNTTGELGAIYLCKEGVAVFLGDNPSALWSQHFKGPDVDS